MAIDPSIPLGFQPQRINTPFENLNIVLQSKQQEQQVKQNALQLKQQEKEAEDEAALQQIWSQHGNDPQKAIELTRLRNPFLAMKIETDLAHATIANIDRETKTKAAEKAQTDNLLRYFAPLRKGDTAIYQQMVPALFKADPNLEMVFPSEIDSDEGFAKFQAGLRSGDAASKQLADELAAAEKAKKDVADFTLSPGSKRFNAKGEVIAEVDKEPSAGSGFSLSPGQVRYDPQGNVVASRPDRPEKTGVGSSGDAELVDAILSNPGIYSNLTPTIKSRISAQLAARGFTFENAGKPSTAAQKRVMGFFNRAKQADDELERIEPEIVGMGLGGQVRLQLPNIAQSETGQAYTQAQRSFTEARLRKDSGAAIPEQEFANDRRTYFAQPGDSTTTLEQKRRARSALLASLAFESGQAFREEYGDDAGSLIEGYKTRAKPTGGATPKPPSGAAAPQRRNIKGGGIAELRDGKWIRVK